MIKLENYIWGPRVCEYDFILKKSKRRIRSRGSRQVVPIRNLLLRSEAQVRALTVRLKCCGASELLGWVSYLTGP